MYAEAAIEDLRWLGIRWQEGPDKGGPFAPYVQSKRRSIYLAAWRKLLRRGFLFPCRCSRKDLETALGAPHERVTAAMQGGSLSLGKLEPLDDEPIYPGTCRPLAGQHSAVARPHRAARSRSRRASTGASAFPTAKRLSLRTAIWARSALWPAWTLATLWCGGATAFRVTSWPAWPMTRP